MKNKRKIVWLGILVCICLQLLEGRVPLEVKANQEVVEVGGVEVPKDLLPYLGRGRSLVAPKEPLGAFRSAGDMVRITPGKLDAYGTWATNEFQVLSPEGEFLGFCAEPNSGTPAGNYTASILENDFIKWCLIKYKTEPETFQLGQSFYSAAHAIIGYAYTGQTTGLNEGQIQAVQKFLNHPAIQEDLKRRVVRTSEQGRVVEKSMSDYTCYIAMNSLQDIVWVQEVPKGRIKVEKVSSNPGISENNPSYHLSGGIYTIFRDKGCTESVGQIALNGNGEGSMEIPKGKYYVKETKAPKGYGLDEELYAVEVLEGQEVLVGGKKVQDSPQNMPLNLILTKKDKELKQSIPLGGGSLEGAEYKISYHPKGEREKQALRTWYFQTDERGEIHLTQEKKYFLSEKSDALYQNEWGEYTIPLGTLVIQETKPPLGYLKNEEILEIQVEEVLNQKVEKNLEGVGTARLEGKKAGLSLEQVIRGDIAFRKISFETQKPLSGVVFEVTSKETGEKHKISTDENGYWSSASDYIPHSQNTNEGSSKSGIWFGESKAKERSPVDDGLGAFPYGIYEFREILGSENQGKEMIHFEVKIQKNGRLVDLGTKSNQDVKKQMEMKTKASSYGKKTVEPAPALKIQDICSIKGLEVGKTYILEGKQMIREENQSLKKDGQEVRGRTMFQATEKDMEVVVEFEVDTTHLQGKHLVTFETLWEEGKEKPILTHEDLSDENQTIQVMEVAKGKAVKTGDAHHVSVYVGLLLSSISFLLLFRRKERLNERETDLK